MDDGDEARYPEHVDFSQIEINTRRRRVFVCQWRFTNSISAHSITLAIDI